MAEKTKICNVCQKQGDELKTCGKCRQVYYCNRDCQLKDWPTHKTLCNNASSSSESSQSSSISNNSTPKKKVLLVNSIPYLGEMYADFLTSLRSRCSLVTCAAKSTKVLQQLSSTKFDCILLADPELSKEKKVNEAIRDFAKQGGTVVMACQFSSNIEPNTFNYLMGVWDLPWKFGTYHRTTFGLYPLTHNHFVSNTKLPKEISMKAVHLDKVEDKDRVYLPSGSSKIESFVFPNDRVAKDGQTPVAYTQYGKGIMGYVGDVNGESDADEIVFALLGI